MPLLPRPRALQFVFRQRALARNLTALGLALLVGAAATALQLAGAASSPLSALDEAAHDLLLRSQPADTVLGSLGISHAADPRSFITIVAIDERSIAELGSYNGGYPRSYHAQVIENLLGHFLTRYRRRHPGVEIHLVEDGGVRLNSRLERGDVHLVLMAAGPAAINTR